MKFQEVARRLDDLGQGFADATNSFEQIFRDLKITSDITVPERAPCTTMYAASAAVVADIERLMREAADPDSISVAMQLGKIGEKTRLALPGGAVLSEQELAWINAAENSGKDAPPNLFYMLAQKQLVEGGALSFSYDLDLASSRFVTSLRNNLKRELGEELGAEAASQVSFGEFLAGDRTTTLTSLDLPSAEVSKQIATSLASRGVTIDDKNALRGIFRTVVERVAIAHGPLELIEALSINNVEAKGIRVKSLGEMLDLAKKTAESPETYRNFKSYHSDRHGSDGVRNPSTTWGLGLLVGWIKERVIAADNYVNGSPLIK